MFRSNDREAGSHVWDKDGGHSLAGSLAECDIWQACPQPCLCETAKFTGTEFCALCPLVCCVTSFGIVPVDRTGRMSEQMTVIESGVD